jgi:eukaryotic-like serine/threonine-protein kinase
MHSSHKRLARFTMSPTHVSELEPKAERAAQRAVRPASMEPCAGTARFQLVGLIALGGMGVVHHAYDILMQRHVALKSLRPERANSRHDSDELLHEARLTAQLEHPNIVPVYELLEATAHGPASFAMRLIHGQNLAERLSELGSARLAPAELRCLLELLLKVCDALAYAHRQGVLHLDLKAENIMLDSSGHVYVMDWGVAVRCARDAQGRLLPLEGSRGVRGTLSHMAPEQLAPNLAGVDERTDVYGLGGVLYQVLSGKAPFPASGSKQGAMGARKELTFEACEVEGVRRLPRRLRNLLLRALAPAKKRRFPSVLALREELTRVIAEGTLAGSSTGAGADLEAASALAARWPGEAEQTARELH